MNRAMKFLSLCLPALAIALVPSVLFAGIAATGSVAPAIGTWGSDTLGFVGEYDGALDGSVTVDAGDDLVSNSCGIGGYFDPTNGYGSNEDGPLAAGPGTVTITGPGSTWTNTLDIQLGQGLGGVGTLYVTNGGLVTTKSISGSPMGGASTVYLDGGTLQAQPSTLYLMSSLTNAYVQAGGITIDSQSANILISSALKVDPSSPGGGLTKTGSGSLALTVVNTYTGTTLISQGTLQLGNRGVGSVVGDIVNNGTLKFYHNNPTTCSNAISGTGEVVKIGNYNLTLTGADTYTGNTTITAGTLTLGDAGSLVMDIHDLTNTLITVASGKKLDLFGTINLDLDDVAATSGLWTLVNNSGTTVYEPTFALKTTGGASFTQVSDVWTYQNGNALWTFTEATHQLSLSAVPEPATLTLLACGLVGLLAYAWRKRK